MTETSKKIPNDRLISLDAFRGFTMLLLIGEFTGVFNNMTDSYFDGTIISTIGTQLHHIRWDGLHFWDLVQPFFMFIVGVAIPFSERNRLRKGSSNQKVLIHGITRSGMLFLFGWGLYCIGPGHITFRLTNVLTQLSFTYLISFLIRNKSINYQLVVSIGFIAITEILYRGFWVEGFNQPFIPKHDFGAYFELLISGSLSGGNWVAFNAFPTAAHTVWGLIVGKILLMDKPKLSILKILLISGFAILILGYSASVFTPIIKKSVSSSFVLVSGGWSILSFSLFYWIIDIKGKINWSNFIVIVGMNPLFIYLFAHVGGNKLVHSIVKPFSFGVFEFLGDLPANMTTNLITWYCLWYLTYWLYKRKIFIKI